MAKSVFYNNMLLMQNFFAFVLHEAWTSLKDPKLKKLAKEKLDAYIKALDKAEKDLLERYNEKNCLN